MHLRMGMRVGKLSATSRLPAYRTTWQLFPRTVPKLLLFLPSIVNMLPIFPGEGAFSLPNPRPTQHFRSPLPRPHMSPPPRLPRAQALHPRCRLHSPQTPSPGPWRPHPRLAPVLSLHAASLLGLCAAISGFFGPISPQIPRKRSTQNSDRWRAASGGRKGNETPATGGRVRVRCRQVSVDKRKAKTRGCVLRYRAKQSPNPA